MYGASFENLSGILDLIGTMGLYICMIIIAAVGIEILKHVFTGDLDAETLELTDLGRTRGNAIEEIKRCRETVRINNVEIPVKKLFLKSLFSDTKLSNIELKKTFYSLPKESQDLINIIRPELKEVFKRC